MCYICHNMIFHTTSFRWLCYTAVGLLAACRPPAAAQEPALSAYFRPLPPTDTLHVEISTDDSLVGVDTIPSELFFKIVPAALLEEIDYVADFSQALVLGRQYFPLNDSITAWWVEIRQFWFQHHLLLLYNKPKKAFTDRVMLAEWYGGDGGQILTGSWLFDFDGDGKKDIVRREIQHSLVLDGEEPQERIEQSASILLWKEGHFVDMPLPDTAAIIKRFPIRSFWP